MKISASVLLALVSIIFITSISYTEPDNKRYADAKTGLVLREIPDASGKKIALIPEKEEVTLLEEKEPAVTIAGKNGKWSKIKWKNKTGWAFGGFLKSAEIETVIEEEGDNSIGYETECISGDCSNGHGTQKNGFGSVYIGDFKNSFKDGQGTITYGDDDDNHSRGDVYTGQWKQEYWNGKGTFTKTDGTRYDGEWKNSKMHGKGTKIYPDGNKYTGEWEDDFKCGKGTMTYPDGHKDEGNWKDNRFLGK